VTPDGLIRRIGEVAQLARDGDVGLASPAGYADRGTTGRIAAGTGDEE
jgi:hypothetical protein